MRLDTSEEIALFRYNEPINGDKIDSFTDYALGLLSAIMQAQENQHLHSDDWQRTIYINTLDVKATDFDLSEKKKMDLLQSGINGAEDYFQ
jgi:NTE family protein